MNYLINFCNDFCAIFMMTLAIKAVVTFEGNSPILKGLFFFAIKIFPIIMGIFSILGTFYLTIK